MELCAVLLPVTVPFVLFRALAALVEWTVVNVVARERKLGAGELKVESALCVVAPPTPVAAVFPECPAVLFAVLWSVAMVGATLLSPCLLPPSKDERKDAALSCCKFWAEVKDAVRRVGMVERECWFAFPSAGKSVLVRYGDALAFFFLELLFFLEVSLKFVNFFIQLEKGRRRPGRSRSG